MPYLVAIAAIIVFGLLARRVLLAAIESRRTKQLRRDTAQNHAMEAACSGDRIRVDSVLAAHGDNLTDETVAQLEDLANRIEIYEHDFSRGYEKLDS